MSSRPIAPHRSAILFPRVFLFLLLFFFLFLFLFSFARAVQLSAGIVAKKATVRSMGHEYVRRVLDAARLRHGLLRRVEAWTGEKSGRGWWR